MYFAGCLTKENDLRIWNYQTKPQTQNQYDLLRKSDSKKIFAGRTKLTPTGLIEELRKRYRPQNIYLNQLEAKNELKW